MSTNVDPVMRHAIALLAALLAVAACDVDDLDTLDPTEDPAEPGEPDAPETADAREPAARPHSGWCFEPVEWGGCAALLTLEADECPEGMVDPCTLPPGSPAACTSEYYLTEGYGHCQVAMDGECKPIGDAPQFDVCA